MIRLDTWRKFAAKSAIGVALLATPARADDCRLALVLALDVSSSVDAHEDQLQRTGLAAAMIAPEVRRAFLAAPQPVALAVFEWSGRFNQQLLLDWTLIQTDADLLAAATILGRSTRSTDKYPTALGHAVGHASGVFDRGPVCAAQVLDVSGDGKNNEGYSPTQAYAAFAYADIVVNGLAIETSGSTSASLTAVPTNFGAYYAAELIHGPGAFVEVAQGFADFERAMRRKLERELAPMVVGMVQPSR